MSIMALNKCGNGKDVIFNDIQKTLSLNLSLQMQNRYYKNLKGLAKKLPPNSHYVGFIMF